MSMFETPAARKRRLRAERDERERMEREHESARRDEERRAILSELCADDGSISAPRLAEILYSLGYRFGDC